MVTLLLVGLVSGLVTAISPCVLPVLPVVLTTSVGRKASPRRPFVLVAGLVLSFGAVTLLGAAVLNALGLPADLLRWAGVAVLGLVGLSLLWPRLGHVVEAPFARLRPPRLDRDGNAFVLGLGMGLVFVPCAGPVLASITVLAATARVGPELVALTAAYCLGIALPLLGFAVAGDRLLARVRAVRERTRLARGAPRAPSCSSRRWRSRRTSSSRCSGPRPSGSRPCPRASGPTTTSRWSWTGSAGRPAPRRTTTRAAPAREAPRVP